MERHRLRWSIEGIISDIASSGNKEFGIAYLLQQIPDSTENEIWDVLIDLARETPNKLYILIDYRCPNHLDKDLQLSEKALIDSKGQLMIHNFWNEMMCIECETKFKPAADTSFVRLMLTEEYLKYAQGQKSNQS